MIERPSRRPRIFTVGHGDSSIGDFLAMLERSSVRLVADIRSNPASPRHPWFERHALAVELERCGLSYRWFRGLGERGASCQEGDAHDALLDPAHRAYACAMNTESFHRDCEELIGLAASAVVTVMSEKRDLEKCHRRLLADKLSFMGVRVVHILTKDDAADHVRNPAVELDDRGALMYRKKQLSLI